MQVIITAPEAQSMFAEDLKGPQPATFDGSHFYVHGVKLLKDYCFPVITKKDTKPITNARDFDFKYSDKFKILIDSIYNNCTQAALIHQLMNKVFDNWRNISDYPVNYIDVDSNGNITYLDYLKAQALEIVGGDMYNNKNRTSCSPGSFYAKIAGPNSSKIGSDYCEQFADRVRGWLAAQKDVENGLVTEVEGKDIVELYKERNYYESSGTLNNSCMRYDKCSPFIEFYALHTDVCKMIVYYTDSKKKIKARALLWTDVQGKKLVDRIYSINGTAETVIKNYAALKGYTIIDRNKQDPSYLVKLHSPRVKWYPYMDTLKYIDILNGYISNNASHSALNKEATTTIASTSGVRPQTNIEVQCGVTGDMLLKTEATWCTFEGIYAKQELAISFPNGKSCLKTAAITDAITGQLILKEDAINIVGIGWTAQIDNANLVKEGNTGNWIRKEDAVRCDWSNLFYHKDSIIRNANITVYKDNVSNYTASKRYNYKENLILA